jgi:hypothetical protein
VRKYLLYYLDIYLSALAADGLLPRTTTERTFLLS